MIRRGSSYVHTPNYLIREDMELESDDVIKSDEEKGMDDTTYNMMDDRGRKNKDKDEDPFAGSNRGLKKRKTSKDAEPTTGKADAFRCDWFKNPTPPQEPNDLTGIRIDSTGMDQL
ncbi:hypothetical protein Tco_0158930 [Tanacetum coccineum]